MTSTATVSCCILLLPFSFFFLLSQPTSVLSLEALNQQLLESVSVGVEGSIEARSQAGKDALHAMAEAKKKLLAADRKEKEEQQREELEKMAMLSKPKPLDKYCTIEVTGSSVTNDYDIAGKYEHLKGVVSNDHDVFYDAKKRQFIFYLTDFNCWGIGNIVGDQGEGLFAYANSKAEMPLGLIGEWKTSMNYQWTEDPDVRLKCEDDGPGLLEQVPLGYTMRNGFLSDRKACDSGSVRTDHWTALSLCWDDPECAGVTHHRTDSGDVETEVYMKSCVEFVENKNWVTYVKNGDDNFEPPQLHVIFRNDLNEDVKLLEVHGEEEIYHSLLNSGEDSHMKAGTGSKWIVKSLNGTTLLSKTISLLGGENEGSLYSISEKNIQEELGKKMKKKYFEETGRVWRNVWPRNPPVHPIWDPVEIGHKRKINTTHLRWHSGDEHDENWPLMEGDTSQPPMELEMETLSIHPKIFTIENVISDDECAYIINRTEGKMVRSKIVKDSRVVTGKGDVQTVHKMRTSTQTWLTANASDVILNIFYRIGDILKLDLVKIGAGEISESLQVVHYAKTQQYRAHHDYFDPDTSADQIHVQNGWNRFATILFYLNPAEEGGGTGFPWAEGGELVVNGKKGSAVIFYSLMEDGNLDYDSKHSGEPVIQGEKYAANLWIWDPRWEGRL